MSHFEREDLQVLLFNNPKGGRPKELGSTVFLDLKPHNSTIDISKVEEDTRRRFHLGYCACSTAITVGEKRMLLFLKKGLDLYGISVPAELEALILKYVMSYPQQGN